MVTSKNNNKKKDCIERFYLDCGDGTIGQSDDNWLQSELITCVSYATAHTVIFRQGKVTKMKKSILQSNFCKVMVILAIYQNILDLN